MLKPPPLRLRAVVTVLGLFITLAAVVPPFDGTAVDAATGGFFPAAVDTSPPTTSFSIIPGAPDGANGWYKTRPTITLTPNETASVHHRWNSAAWSGDGVFDPFVTVAVPDYNENGWTGNGLYALEYFSVDAADNTETVKQSEIKVDDSAPDVDLRLATPSELEPRRVTLFIGAVDDYRVSSSGLDAMRFRNAGGAWSDWQAYAGSRTWTLTPGGGDKVVYAQVRDNAGNIGTGAAERRDPRLVHYLNWYDAIGPLKTRLVIANPTNTYAEATVTIGGRLRKRLIVPARRSVPLLFDGLRGGPVEVATSVKTVVSQRTHYSQSFDEIVAVAGTSERSGLGTVHYLPWYDSSGAAQTWLLVGNPNNRSISAYIYVVGRRATMTIAARTTQAAYFPGVSGGPVKVVTGRPAIVSARTHYNQSFNETLAVRAADMLDSRNTYYYPWYSSSGAMNSWLVMYNPRSVEATASVYIGGRLKQVLRVPSGQVVIRNYRGAIGGPVRIVSSLRLVIAQRTLHNGAFSETLAVKGDDFESGRPQHFPWYGSTGSMATNIPIANPDSTPAVYSVYVGGVLKRQLTVAPGAVAPVFFSGTIGGPVSIVTDGKALVSQRSFYYQSFNETLPRNFPSIYRDITW